MYNHIDGEVSQYICLHCSQDQARAERYPQLRGEGVIQRSPKHQGVVGNKQGVGKHHSPGPGDSPQLPKGEKQQVELQDQPEISNKCQIVSISLRQWETYY